MSGAVDCESHEEIVQVDAGQSGGVDAMAAEFAALHDQVLAEVEGLRVERNRLQLDAALAGSGLPAECQAVIRQAVTGVDGQQLGALDLGEVQRLLELQRGALAAAVQPSVVSGMRPITGRELRTGADELMIACQIYDHQHRRRSYELAAGVRALL